MEKSIIRFLGKGDVYFIKFGPLDHSDPPERVFQGGEEVEVALTERADNPGVVDLEFPDGQLAYEVPRKFFTVVQGSA